MSATSLQVDISRALAIDGWMEPDELQWLAENAATHKRIVELGSYMGRSTRALADHTRGVVYALDTWEGPWEIDLPVEHRANLFRAFQENLADHIAANRVIPLKVDHALPPTGIRPDMVFIDGDHSMGSVMRDIQFWLRELQHSGGGLLCGHDWDALPVRDGVRQCLGDNIAICNQIWSVNV